MQIGDLVISLGTRYILRGLDPIDVPDRLAQIEDTQSDVVLAVPVDAWRMPRTPRFEAEGLS